jgi:hypothetical protein
MVSFFTLSGSLVHSEDENGGSGLQVRKVTANTLNKQ